MFLKAYLLSIIKPTSAKQTKQFLTYPHLLNGQPLTLLQLAAIGLKKLKLYNNMAALEYITIKCFDGTEKSGFEIKQMAQLPKSAKFSDCFYDDHFNNYNIYVMYGKNKIKYFIRKTRI
jgi:hypothetical protein